MSLLCGSCRGSEERPRHCCGTKLRGDWDGRRSPGEGFETTAPLGPQLRLRLGAASPGPVYGSFALGQRGSPRRGSTSLSPAGCGVKISVSAAGLLRCGRRTGKSPGREVAEPELPSRRPEEGQGTSGLRAPPAPSANSPAAGMESGRLGEPSCRARD